jgi:hypothetical protein
MSTTVNVAKRLALSSGSGPTPLTPGQTANRLTAPLFTADSHVVLKLRLTATCMLCGMSETHEHPTDTTGPVSAQPVAPPPPPLLPQYKPSRLTQVAAWVGIVAGVVFIVAVIFFSGFTLGRHSGGGHFGDGHQRFAEFHHRMPMGPMGQFERPPAFEFPGGPGVQPPQPPQGPGGPTTTAPARP